MSPITNNSLSSMYNNQHTGALSRRENLNPGTRGGASYLLNTIHNDT